MKMYRVKKEFIDNWTDECLSELVVSEKEIKSLASDWGMTIKSLMEEVEPIAKREVVKIERYRVGDYIMEAEEVDDSVGGHMFKFWLYRKGYGVKDFMFGWPVNQPNAKDGHTFYTKEECLELAFCNICDYIDTYKEEYEGE